MKIKAIFDLKTFPWQVSVVIDIAQYKKEIFVIAGTNARKNLTYQSIFKTTGSIILIIFLTIALIKNQ